MAQTPSHRGIAGTLRGLIAKRRRNRALGVALDQIADVPRHLRQDLLRQTADKNDHIFRSITSNTFVCVIAPGGAIFAS